MKTNFRARFWLISSFPLAVFFIDLAMDGTLSEWEAYDTLHMGFVGLTACFMALLLKTELRARHGAEETLKREHAGLEETIRQRAEEHSRTLRYEQKVLEAIMENSQTMLVYLDLQMRFVHANTAYVKGCGHTREELIGQNHFALFPDPENEAIFVRARDTGEPVSFMAKPFEFPDQPWRGVTYWDWMLVPIKDASGAVSGLVFSLRDVTEEYLSTNRREEHLARLNALIKVSERVLGERTAENLFQSIADAAREVTGAKVAVAGHGQSKGTIDIRASSRAENTPPCPTEVPAASEAKGLYREVMESAGAIRLSDEELRSHPGWRGLPPGHFPLRGLLGIPMNGSGRGDGGFIMVSDKKVGDFSEEDEALLSQLAALTSLSLRHIDARTHAEHYAARMDAIFGAMTDAVIAYDVTGVAVRANPAAVRLMGFEPVGSDVHTILTHLKIHGDDGREYDIAELPTSRALAGETVIGKRLLVRGGDGAERIVRASSSPLWLDGSFIGAVTIWADQTERERLHQQLEMERAKLKTIIDTVPGGIVVTDEQARVQMVNPAAERLYARRFRIGESFDKQADVEFPPQDETASRPPELSVAHAAIFGEGHREVEMQVPWPDGSHRHLLANSAPIADATGRIGGAVGIFQDITLRKHDEEALKEREREYFLLMEQAADGIVLVDLDGTIVAANSRVCEMLGYQQGELIRQNGRGLIPPEDLPSLMANLGTITPGNIVITEHRAYRKDGTVIFVETSARRLSDGRTQAIARDITERKKREEEYSRAVKPHVFDRLFSMLREFQHGEVLAMNLSRLALFARNLNVLSSADHSAGSVSARLEAVIEEFRSITRQKLVGIASLLRTVEVEFAAAIDAPAERVTADAIIALTESLWADTENLLTIIHPGPGDAPHKWSSISGVAIAERAESLLLKIVVLTRQMNERYTASVTDVAVPIVNAYRAQRPGIPIEIIESNRGLKALTSSAELAEILSLLMTNAFDAMAGIGSEAAGRQMRITIRLREQEGRVRVEVEDTGPGVPPEFRERIFERGFSTKGESRGSGLSFVSDHLGTYGGELTYEEPAGGGARFVISLVRM